MEIKNLYKSEYKKDKELKRLIFWIRIVLFVVILSILASFIQSRTYYSKETENTSDSFVGIINSAHITAYNSVPEQTDDTPFITASGLFVYDGIVANNCLPFGTKVEIEGRLYEVQDRMNSRYGCEYFDIWMEDVDNSKKWGVKHDRILIVY